MCLNKRYIKNIHGDRILVKCGHCDACLQEKAIARKNRIENTFCDKYIPLFVTLTYENSSVPYIRYDELCDSSNFYNVRCNVYRDSSRRFVRVNETDYALRTIYEREIIGVVDLPLGKCKEDKFISLHGQSDFNKIAVCWYKDIQNFIKRLKVNLERHYGIPPYFKYFSCTEYGPSSMRCHAHLLFFAEVSSFSVTKWKNAIYESWTFSDLRRRPRCIEFPKNISGYISSYVNCSNSLPYLFSTVSEFKPKHSYSKAFGISKEYLSLSKVYESYTRRDLHYIKERITNGVSVETSLLIPKYVISRYCPQFKGFSRLNAHALYDLVLRPSKIFEYSEVIGIDLKQCYQTEVLLRNRIKFALSSGLNIFEFADFYSHVWSLRACQAIKDSLLQISNFKDWYTAYDNIDDLYFNKVENYTLETYPVLNLEFITDCNKFPDNVRKHNNLVSSFASYNKDRKIRNFIYSKNNFI